MAIVAVIGKLRHVRPQSMGNDTVRILVLGAGAIGGYFGGRLAAAGVDTTFLVRPGRAEQLAKGGLRIASPLGDVNIPVQTVTREHAVPGYDAILLSCKAYDLDDAIDAIRPAVAGAVIIPLLNGMRHLDRLETAFGKEAVGGGVAALFVGMEPDGLIRHVGQTQTFVFGERHPAHAERCAALAPVLARGGFSPRHSREIAQDMWEKFVFICTAMAGCCLMRGGVGEVARTNDGAALMLELLEDCAAVATANGHAQRPAHAEFCRKTLADPASPNIPSMLRDLRQGNRVEADHIVGDMLARARALGRPASLLRAAYANLQVYQAARV
jgi:2-dehydropantoate 2-reductase